MTLYRFLIVSFLSMALTMGQALAQTIATVDFQRALTESNKGAAAQTQLESFFKQKQDAVAAMEQELMTKEAEYQQQAMVLTETAKQAKQAELMQMSQVYQQTAYAAEMEMQQTYTQLMEGLLIELRGVAEALGKEKGYTLILEVSNGGVVYSGSGVADVTDELIKRYDSQGG
jgi:outer membrane protein